MAKRIAVLGLMMGILLRLSVHVSAISSALELVHPETVDRIQLLPDSPLLAAQMDNGAIIVWDTTTGKRITSLPPTEYEFMDSYFISETRILTVTFPLSNVEGDTLLKMWDITSGDLLYTVLAEEPVFLLDFEPDYRWFVLPYPMPEGCDGDDCVSTRLVIYDTETGQPLRELWHDTLIRGFPISPDGKHIVAIQDTAPRCIRACDTSLVLWDTATGNRLWMRNLDTTAQRILWSDDGDTFMVMTTQAVMLWTIDGSLQWTISIEPVLYGIQPITTQERMLIIDQDREITIWDVSAGELLYVLDTNSDAANHYIFRSPDEGQIGIRSVSRSSCDEDCVAEIRLFDTASGELTATLPHHDEMGNPQWSPDGSLIMTTDAIFGEGGRAPCDCAALIWDARTGEQVSRLPHQYAVTYHAWWLHDSSHILTYASFWEAHLWDITTGEAIFHMEDSSLHKAYWDDATDRAFFLLGNRLEIWNMGELLD